MNRRQQYDFDDEINELDYLVRYRHQNDRNRHRSAEEMLPRKANRNRPKRNQHDYDDY